MALRYMQAGRALVGDGSVGDYLQHEVGHHVQWEVLDAKTNNLIGSRMNEYAAKVSGYATATKGEYIAESFSAYVKGQRNILDPEFVSFMDGKRLDNFGKSGIIKSGSDIVALEEQRYGRNKNTLVNKTFIDSGEYKRKFDNATDNPVVNKSLYDCAKKALKHRSGTVFEDMYWINSNTGNIELAVTDSTAERGIPYSDKIIKAITGRTDLITLHTHPGSMPPSISDLNKNFEHNYRTGFIACHNGRVFGYNCNEEINQALHDLYVAEYQSMGYDEYSAQLASLNKLKENHDFDFWEVT